MQPSQEQLKKKACKPSDATTTVTVFSFPWRLKAIIQTTMLCYAIFCSSDCTAMSRACVCIYSIPLLGAHLRPLSLTSHSSTARSMLAYRYLPVGSQSRPVREFPFTPAAADAVRSGIAPLPLGREASSRETVSGLPPPPLVKRVAEERGPAGDAQDGVGLDR